MVERPHPAAGGQFHLAADVALACRVVADEHDGKAGYDMAVAGEPVHGIRHLAAQVRGDRLPVNDPRGHAGPVRAARFAGLVQIFARAAASPAALPETLTRLRRALSPATRLTSRWGTPSVAAMSLTSAAFACPSDGGARTRACRTAFPSASCAMPSIASRSLRGVSRTDRTSPDASLARELRDRAFTRTTTGSAA